MRFKFVLVPAILIAAVGCFKKPGEQPAPIEEGVGVEPARKSTIDPDARAIVEKAIKAHGGPEAVAKLRTMRIKVEGTGVVPGDQKLPFVLEDTWKMPDRYKSSNFISFKGKDFRQSQVIDGDTGWTEMNGKVMDMPKEALAEMKEQKYGEDFDRLGFLDMKGLTITKAADAAVDGPPLAGVRIQSDGHREVTLYFDKTSGLLTMRTHWVLDKETGKEVAQSVVFRDYEKKDGVMHYRKISALQNGKPMFEAKVIEIDFNPKIDESTFAKPK